MCACVYTWKVRVVKDLFRQFVLCSGCTRRRKTIFYGSRNWFRCSCVKFALPNGPASNTTNEVKKADITQSRLDNKKGWRTSRAKEKRRNDHWVIMSVIKVLNGKEKSWDWHWRFDCSEGNKAVIICKVSRHTTGAECKAEMHVAWRNLSEWNLSGECACEVFPDSKQRRWLWCELPKIRLKAFGIRAESARWYESNVIGGRLVLNMMPSARFNRRMAFPIHRLAHARLAA